MRLCGLAGAKGSGYQAAREVSIFHVDCNVRKAARMRAIVNVLVTAAAIGLCGAQLEAAPASVAAQQNFTPLTLMVQGGSYSDDFLPACPNGYFYACWYQPYGHRYCGCWPGGDRPACPEGYHYSCRADASGNRHCACW
jgi:hypothetical protein